MKSAEEIISGLECCESVSCRDERGGPCPYDGATDCAAQVLQDAVALIRQLQAENETQADTIKQLLAPFGDRLPRPRRKDEFGRKCLELIKFATEGLEGVEAVCTANALERLCYWKKKEGVEDLRRAEFWIEELITEKEAKP